SGTDPRVRVPDQGDPPGPGLHPGGRRLPAPAAGLSYFVAKQKKRPAPPVLFRSFWLQPPSGPRDGCDEFQDLEASSSRRPCRSESPTISPSFSLFLRL